MIFTERELFLLVICAVTYITLFIVTVQNSRRKILSLQDRLEKIRRTKEEQEASSSQRIAYNKERILELENLLQKIGDENSMLKLELEEKKAHLDYTNKVAMIESEKREQAETVIFGSDVYLRMQNSLNEGRMMDETDWQALSDLVNRVYSGFTEKLYELYNLSSQDYRVSLLIKVRVQPKDIAILTAHSKESVASTRSRLYSKVFGKKGSSKDWDEFILSI